MTSGSTSTLRRPSNDPDVLRAQLLRELIALDSPPGSAPPRKRAGTPGAQPDCQEAGSASSNPLAVERSALSGPAAAPPAPGSPPAPSDGDAQPSDASSEPALCHAYLQHALLLVWRGVAQGNLHVPRQMLERLRPAQRFVDRHLPRCQTRAEVAAAELLFTLDCLHLADQALQEARTSQRLADRRRSSTEREVLRALSHNRHRYLRRGAVWEEMSSLRRPTQARVGQILADLREQGVVQRTFGRAQGNPDSSFYALSPMGIEICENLGLGQAAAMPERAATLAVTMEDTAPLIESAAPTAEDPVPVVERPAPNVAATAAFDGDMPPLTLVPAIHAAHDAEPRAGSDPQAGAQEGEQQRIVETVLSADGTESRFSMVIDAPPNAASASEVPRLVARREGGEGTMGGANIQNRWSELGLDLIDTPIHSIEDAPNRVTEIAPGSTSLSGIHDDGRNVAAFLAAALSPQSSEDIRRMVIGAIARQTPNFEVPRVVEHLWDTARRTRSAKVSQTCRDIAIGLMDYSALVTAKATRHQVVDDTGNHEVYIVFGASTRHHGRERAQR